MPSHDTSGRVLAALEPPQSEACLINWLSRLCPALAAQFEATDDKTLRDLRHRGERAIHRVSVCACGLGVTSHGTPGQVRTAGKRNKIPVIPELPEALSLKGAIVTIESMGCQREIAMRIVNAGANREGEPAHAA